MIKSSFQLKTVGGLLKEKRSERNLTLKQVSEATKIRSEYLEALEQSNYEAFPSEVYIKGFLKNYSKFLGISQDHALALYRRESEARVEPTIGVIAKIREKGLNLSLTPNKIIAVAVGVGILIILIYLGTYLGRVLKKPKLLLTSPVVINEDSEGTFKTPSNVIELQGEVELGSSLKINGQELKLNNFEKFTKEFKLEDGLNTFVLKAESQFGRETQVTLNVVKEGSEPSLTITPTTSVTPTVIPTLEIVAAIEIINKEAYLEVYVDSEKKTTRVYAIGSKLDFTAKTKFEIFSPRPDAVKLTINGAPETIGNQKVTWVIENGQLVKK